MSHVDAKIGHLLEPWLMAQEPLSAIKRWSSFYEQGNRQQDGAQHTASICLLAVHVCDVVARHLTNLDRALILGAFPVHDLAEAILGRDVPRPQKSAHYDVAEYHAFMELVSRLGGDPGLMQRRFLLQFALGDDEYFAHFPENARRVLIRLRSAYAMEARIFRAVEFLDYMLYILEHVREDGELGDVFAALIGDVASELSRLATEIPGFDNVWTVELDWWARSLMPAAKAAE